MHRPFPHLLPILAASAALLLQACGDESRAPDEPSASPSGEPGSAQSASPSDATARLAAAVNDLADRTYEFALRATPEIAYFSGVEPPRHDGMEDNSTEGRRAREEEIDALLAELEQRLIIQ